MLLFNIKRRQIKYKPKIWLYADMEGVNNITRWDEVNPACINFKKGAKLMTEEVNSAVKGIFKGGAQDVFINDIHWFYNNIIWRKIDKRATSCLGANLNIPVFLSNNFDAVVIVGMHAKANSRDSILPHSWYLPSYIQSLKFNQKFIGEIDLIKFLADEKGVPVIFISGDKAGCLEAIEIVPNIFTVITKEKTLGKITSLPRKKVNKLIYKKSMESVGSLIENVDSLKINTIIRSQPLEVVFASIELAKTIESKCKVKNLDYEAIGKRTVKFKGNFFSEILENFFNVLD